MNNPTCPQCQRPQLALTGCVIGDKVAITLECPEGHDTVKVLPVSRFTLTFGDVEAGANFFTLDGLHYRKTRPWHNDEQWNASLWSDVEMPMFTRFEDSTEVYGSY